MPLALRRPVLISLLFLLGFVWVQRSMAAPDYLVDVKDTEDDLPSSTVTSITQTPEGYLWIGTYNGLSRFDGERFVTYHPVNTPELSQARIQGLYVDAEGTLWINTFRGGLTSYRDGVFKCEWKEDAHYFDLHTTMVWSSPTTVIFVTQFGEVLCRSKAGDRIVWKLYPPPEGSRPLFQCASGDGKIWMLGRDDGKLLCFADGGFKEFANDVLAGHRISAAGTDAQGRLWIGADKLLGCWDGKAMSVMTPTNGEPMLNPTTIIPMRNGSIWILDGDRFRKAIGREWVAEARDWRGRLRSASGRNTGVHEDSVGGLWLNHYGNGVFHTTPDGTYERFTTIEGLPGDRVGAWFQSRDGSIWLGVDRGGLVRLRERRFHVIGQAEGLPARAALSVCEDRQGAVWIGTGGGGLCRWSDGKLTQFRVGNNVSANFVFSVFPRHDGGVWLSAAEGEDFYFCGGDQVQRAQWEVHGIKSILTDRAGRVWVGTKNGLAWWSVTDRRVFGTNDGVSLSSVRALAEAPDGGIWAGSDDGVLYRCEPDRVKSFKPDDALRDQSIWSLLADKEGTIWAGTFRGGLLRFKDGKFSRFTVKQGLPVDVISQILEDEQGRIWLGTHQGICAVSKAELNEFADGKISRVDWVTYGRLDGLPTLECSDGYQPACWRGGDGKLWFTTVRGLVSVNPRELTTNSIPAPVLIEEVWVDGESMPITGGKMKIPPGRKRYEFRYTALSFEATRFRYRIVNYDTDWNEAGSRRAVQYSKLPAGNYRFEVIACDDKGVWNPAGASLSFIVQPYFYESRWFILLTALVILGSVAAVVRTVAARKYRARLAKLEQQHAIERDRARIAKDIHDDIGAGLTQITLLSELARREKEQAGTHLDRISNSARELTRAMDEIVWAVDPQHDTFNGLMDYISAFAEDFLRVAGVRCRMDLPTALPEMRVDAELRYNLFLALKETLNNIVKHAGATEVWLRLKLNAGSFTLIVEDNGRGLNGRAGGAAGLGNDRLSSGSGLGNLEKRLRSVGGTCRIESVAGQGTRVEMTVKVPVNA
ncbi:MAG TPA: two-component regulator propeller domain-containing protein [Candidatus Paceibacterota bacterium]|nr:two-component regulator propeller domain-containing protein [Candidatus Paceibacterota bacterium]